MGDNRDRLWCITRLLLTFIVQCICGGYRLEHVIDHLAMYFFLDIDACIVDVNLGAWDTRLD